MRSWKTCAAGGTGLKQIQFQFCSGPRRAGQHNPRCSEHLLVVARAPARKSISQALRPSELANSVARFPADAVCGAGGGGGGGGGGGLLQIV